VERMELELTGQLVELRVVGIIKRVPGHGNPPATRRTRLGDILVRKSEDGPTGKVEDEHRRSLCRLGRRLYDSGKRLAHGRR
jgi:hypothetical protein